MTHREARRRWQRAIRKWQDTLLLNGYTLTLYYEDELPDSNHGQWESVARAESRPMYLQGAVTVSKRFIANATDAEIDEKAAHELMHIVSGRVRHFMNELLGQLPNSKREGFIAWWQDVDEFTTTHLQRIVGAKA